MNKARLIQGMRVTTLVLALAALTMNYVNNGRVTSRGLITFLFLLVLVILVRPRNLEGDKTSKG